jgi:hypothetical protein
MHLSIKKRVKQGASLIVAEIFIEPVLSRLLRNTTKLSANYCYPE